MKRRDRTGPGGMFPVLMNGPRRCRIDVSELEGASLMAGSIGAHVFRSEEQDVRRRMGSGVVCDSSQRVGWGGGVAGNGTLAAGLGSAVRRHSYPVMGPAPHPLRTERVPW